MFAAASDAEFTAIVAAGIQAPSAENRHALEFERDERGITLWATREHLEAAPHRKLLNLIGFGAVAENVLLHARTLGWQARLHISAEVSEHEPLARIDLERSAPESSTLASAIFARHTNRRFFRGPGIAVETQREMEADVAAIPNVVLRWFNERSSKRQVANIARLTEAERFRTPALHEELFAGIRFDVGWRGSADEGLPPGALAIEPPLRPGFSSLRHKAIMRALTAIGVHHVLGIRAGYAPCLSAPTIAVLAYTSVDAHAGCWVIGRAMEQLWLRATVLGFAVQPFIAPGLYSLDCYPAVPQRLRRHLVERWAALVPEGQPLVVLRLGRAEPPTVRTGRKSAQCYIRKTRAMSSESPVGTPTAGVDSLYIRHQPDQSENA